MSLLVHIGRLGRIGGAAGNSMRRLLNLVFNPSLLTLSDIYGNVAEAISVAGRKGTMFDGTMFDVPSTLHHLQRGRLVENQAQYSEDISNAVYVKGATATVTGTQQLNLPADIDSIRQQFSGLVTSSVGGFLVELSGSGTVSVRLRDVSGSFAYLATTQVSLTSEPRIYYIKATLLHAASIGFNCYVQRVAGDTATLVNVSKFMFADVTGKPADYVPEYVPNLGAGATSKYFDTTSGNTASGNIVTEAAGVPLHPSATIRGRKHYLTKEDWTAKIWAAGSECNYNGNWYITVAGGTDVTFGSGVTWVVQGLYHREFGVLSEGAGVNLESNPESLASIVMNSQVTPSMVNNSADSPLGVNTAWTMPDGATGFNQKNTVVPLDSLKYTLTRFISGVSGTVSYQGIGLNTVDTLGWCTLDLATKTFSGVGAARMDIEFVSTVGGVDWYRIGATFQNNGNTNIFINREVPTNTVGYASTGSSVKQESSISSYHAGTRSEGLGSIKYLLAGSKIKTGGTFCFGIGWVPAFASGDIAAANRALVTLNNSAANMIYQHSSSQNKIAGYDATSTTSATMPSWNAHGCIALILNVDCNTSQMWLSYANLSNGDTYTHGAKVAYDGQFTEGTFLQFFAALGGNNSAIRWAFQENVNLTAAEIEAIR